MINPLVSIIMPVYNSEKYLPDAIQSVFNQTYTDWELIIIDDCSTDSSYNFVKQIAATHPQIIPLQLTTNSGAAVARNLGIDKAGGKYIAFLDADDLWLPEKLNMQVAFMEKNNSAITCTYYAVLNNEGIPTNKIITAPAKITYKQLLKNNKFLM